MKFRGSGLAEVRDHKCMGCQVMLRPQKYNEVRNGDGRWTAIRASAFYYYDPANEVKPEQEVVTVTGRKRGRAPRPMRRRPGFTVPITPRKAKCCWCSPIMAAVDAAHLRNALGAPVRRVLIREGNYRQAFPEDLTDTALRLNGHWDEEEMDEWGSEIPSNALDLLQKDLLAIQREHKASHKHAASPAETAGCQLIRLSHRSNTSRAGNRGNRRPESGRRL